MLGLFVWPFLLFQQLSYLKKCTLFIRYTSLNCHSDLVEIIANFYLVPTRLLKKWLINLDLYIQVSVLPPPPRGWNDLNEWNEELKSRRYYILKKNFFTARGLPMPRETVPITIRPVIVNKPDPATFSPRHLLLIKAWEDLKKKRAEEADEVARGKMPSPRACWIFPGPFEPDF